MMRSEREWGRRTRGSEPAKAAASWLRHARLETHRRGEHGARWNRLHVERGEHAIATELTLDFADTALEHGASGEAIVQDREAAKDQHDAGEHGEAREHEQGLR